MKKALLLLLALAVWCEPTHIAATETPFPEKIWRVVSVPSNEVFNLPTLPKADRG